MRQKVFLWNQHRVVARALHGVLFSKFFKEVFHGEKGKQEVSQRKDRGGV